MGDLHAAISECDLFVFNGDIFDFKWSVYPSETDTIRAALNWLKSILDRHSNCEFHYVLGNHDCLRSFTAALAQFESTQPRLTCHPHYFRLGDVLFLHGDVAMAKMDAQGLENYRAKWLQHRRQGRLMNMVYDTAFWLNLHRGVQCVAFPRRRSVTRVRYYLDRVGQGPETGVSAVYFGHTHVALCGYLHKGIEYHNGGATLPGVRFRILRARINV